MTTLLQIKIALIALFFLPIYAKSGNEWRLMPKNRPVQTADKFFISSNKDCSIPLTFSRSHSGKKINWILLDYSGKKVQEGHLTIQAPGKAELSFNLATGWYKLAFPELGYCSGICALNTLKGKRDEFFCLDSVLSWEIRGNTLRRQLVNVQKIMGIYGARERIEWKKVNIDEGKYNFDYEGSYDVGKYDSLATMYREAGIKLLITFHDSPRRLRAKGSPYPLDLAATAKAWRDISEYYKDTWDSLEIWNEPDLGFSRHLPADQYAPLAKAICWGLVHSNSALKIGGGVLAQPNKIFLKSLGDNGVFNVISMFTFHNYTAPSQIQVDANIYRKAFTEFGKPDMPLWFTEAGLTFDLPEREMQDNEYRKMAHNVAAKSAKARALGIKRFYPFILSYWKSFRGSKYTSMLHRDMSAGMGAATYAQAIRKLSRTKFIGNVKLSDKVNALAFTGRNKTEAIIVAYTETPDEIAILDIPFKNPGLEGIDGRTLAECNMQDGLIYITVPLEEISSLLQKVPAKTYKSNMPTPSPYIIYPLPSRKIFSPQTSGWNIKIGSNSLILDTRVYNLSDKEWQTGLCAEIIAKNHVSSKINVPEKKLPAGGFADFVIDIPPTEFTRFSGDAKILLRCTASGKGYRNPESACMNVVFPVELKKVLKSYPNHLRLPIEKKELWKQCIKSGGKSTLRQMDKGIAFDIQFKEKKKMNEWFYPKFTIPSNIDIKKYDALLIRARTSKRRRKADFSVMVNDPFQYKTKSSFLPLDGKYHDTIIRFDSLIVSPWARQDPDDRLNLEKIKHLSVGFGNYRYKNCTLEVSDIYLIPIN